MLLLLLNDHLVTKISRLCCASMALNQRYQESIFSKVTSVVIKLGDVNLLANNFSLVLVMIP